MKLAPLQRFMPPRAFLIRLVVVSARTPVVMCLPIGREPAASEQISAGPDVFGAMDLLDRRARIVAAELRISRADAG